MIPVSVYNLFRLRPLFCSYNRLTVLFTAFVLLACLVTTVPVDAHPMNNGYSKLTIAGTSVTYDLYLRENSLMRFDTDNNKHLTVEELESQRSGIESYIADGIKLESDGEVLKFRLESIAGTIRDGLPTMFLQLSSSSDKMISSFTLDYNLFFDDIDKAHINLFSLSYGDHLEQTVMDSKHRVFSYSDDPYQVWHAMYRYLALGIEHILIGYDHLLFLLSLLLVARKAKEIVKIVTAFTIAHTITLILVATGLMAVSSYWVEALIKLSICYVALENTICKNMAWRSALTFFFGLIHGMGFAGALAETGLPKMNMVVTLLSFNVGVEVGQLFLVLLAFPVLKWLRRYRLYHTGMVTVSCLIFLVAFYWLIERLT